MNYLQFEERAANLAGPLLMPETLVLTYRDKAAPRAYVVESVDHVRPAKKTAAASRMIMSQASPQALAMALRADALTNGKSRFWIIKPSPDHVISTSVDAQTQPPTPIVAEGIGAGLAEQWAQSWQTRQTVDGVGIALVIHALRDMTRQCAPLRTILILQGAFEPLWPKDEGQVDGEDGLDGEDGEDGEDGKPAEGDATTDGNSTDAVDANGDGTEAPAAEGLADDLLNESKTEISGEALGEKSGKQRKARR